MPGALRYLDKLEPMRTMGAKQVTRKIIIIQLLVTLLAAVVSFAFNSLQAAYSALVGGGISIVATLYFASKVFAVRIGCLLYTSRCV